MPELPEVEALAHHLGAQLAGHQITRMELAAFSALKTVEPPLDALVGRTVSSASRRGKVLLIETAGETFGVGNPLWLVCHLSLGGWVRWRPKLAPARARPGRGPLVLRVGLENGTGMDVTEAGTEKRLALWVARSPDDVAVVARLGPDPLDPGFDRAALATALAGQSGQLKGVLTDQAVLAGVGNAYSDEILHVARLSPFKVADRMSPDEVDRLHGALVGVLSEAVARSVGLAAADLKADKRSGLRVHGRAGLACPVCGDTVRQVAFASRSLQYCPTCQTEGRVLADRRLSRLVR
ncbi:MAG: endonuclease VIII [Acidimicrobiales bacterium]|nr:MAG: endonuclease VIII [Acidimicrobiales bacterium]